MSSEEKIKVYSFQSNSSGGIVSVLLFANKKFTLKKLEVEEWEDKKAKFNYEPLPLLKVNKEYYSHETPIILYLGKKFDLMGETSEDEYEIINVLYAITDLKEKILPTFLPETKEEYEMQQSKIDELLDDILPFYLQIFEKHLGKKKYFLGDKPSVLDVYMTYFVYLIFRHPLRINLLEPLLKQYAPNLDELVSRMTENEMKEYFEKYFQVNSPL